MRAWRPGPLTALACVCLLLSACGSLTPQSFSELGPRFEPEKFFEGRTQSWGVIESRSGSPKSRFRTDVMERKEGADLILTQHFMYEDGRTQQRVWRVRRLDEHRYEATANDVVGTAAGEAYGNTFRWEYTLAVNPRNPLTRVHMSHWMYLQNADTMVNRVTVSKAGIVLSQITEYFHRGSDAMADIKRSP